ncbi:MAG: hypothetical protein ACRD5K_02490 [Candidatus Acidiferrales bacterium]
MKKQTSVLPRLRFLLAVLTATIALIFVPIASRAQNVNEVARSGAYTINLKLLPAESFEGPHPAMVHDGGAMPVLVNGPEHPDHHLVVFIKKNGEPVENAHVAITFKQSQWAHWKNLPVARMHAAGKGSGTTHYGNNVNLVPGKYEVRVTVNAARPATFRITIG